MVSSSAAPPNLIDDSARLYVDSLLQKSHAVRVQTHYYALNVAVVCAFVAVFGGFLYYRYVSKPTAAVAFNRVMKDQEFVVSKIRFFKEQNEKINQMSSPITGLPGIETREA